MLVNLENFHFTVTVESRVFQTNDHILCKTGPVFSIPSWVAGELRPRCRPHGGFRGLSRRRCQRQAGRQGCICRASAVSRPSRPKGVGTEYPLAFLTHQPHQDQVTKPLSRPRSGPASSTSLLFPRFCRIRPWLSAQPDLGKGPMRLLLWPPRSSWQGGRAPRLSGER